MPQEPIRIAIVGGGLAGAAIANALVHLPHLEIHVFESSPDFSERGAAIGLAGNAQRALQQFIPSAMDLLNRAGAVPIQSARVMMVSKSCTLYDARYDRAQHYIGRRSRYRYIRMRPWGGR